MFKRKISKPKLRDLSNPRVGLEPTICGVTHVPTNWHPSLDYIANVNTNFDNTKQLGDKMIIVEEMPDSPFR